MADESSEASDNEISSSCSNGSHGSSYGYEAEWAEHIGADGSVFYVESYMSSTLREKQAQALKAASAENKSTFTSPTKQLKKQNKLLSLLKRRPSVRSKTNPVIGSTGENVPGTSGQKTSDLSPPKVTFRDNQSGEVRNVILHVTEENSNLGRRASVCEVVLGVVPGRFSEPPDSRVMVAGLVPGSEALRSGVIKIGDWLKEVNHCHLTWENYDTILKDIMVPSNVTVVVQKCASETLPEEDDENHKRVIQTSLVKVMTSNYDVEDESSFINKTKLKELPHTVLYLSLTGVSEHDPDGTDIKYQFPGWSNKLVQVRGAFITIAHTIQEAVGSPALWSAVSLDGEYYHVAYCRENNDVFLVALPHSCISGYEIVSLMEQLSTLLKYEFGSLASAMINPVNKAYLDHLMSLVLGLVLGNPRQATYNKQRSGSTLPSISRNLYLPHLDTFTSTLPVPSYASPVFAAPSLLLLSDTTIKAQIDYCLSELESGDFGEDDIDCDQCDMLYNIIGSCLFYKNYLVMSHLPGDLQHELWLFAVHHGLLRLVSQEAVSQMVVWRPVHPNNIPQKCSSNIVNHHILFVAMNHTLLGMLVESGNVTELLEEMAGPDPVLVDQVETTLYQLHGLHIHNFCEEILSNGGIETSSVDERFGGPLQNKLSKQKSSENVEATTTVRMPDVPSILKQRSSPVSDWPLTSGVEFSAGCECGELVMNEKEDVSDDSHTHSSIDSSSPTVEEDSHDEQESSQSDWQLWKNKDGTNQTNYDQDKRMSPKSPVHPFSVTIGKECVLLHMIHLDVGEGVLIDTLSYTSVESSTNSPIIAEITENFRSTCGHIHHVLHSAERTKDFVGQYIGSCALSGVREHGVMFTVSPDQSNTSSGSGWKKRSEVITYWVVGKLMSTPYQREVYVCYDDAVPQNILEVAFRVSLGFGL